MNEFSIIIPNNYGNPVYSYQLGEMKMEDFLLLFDYPSSIILSTKINEENIGINFSIAEYDKYNTLNDYLLNKVLINAQDIVCATFLKKYYNYYYELSEEEKRFSH